MRVRKAIIPAAGLGTRFLPATKAMPKEMLPIVDVPAVQYIVEESVSSGIEEILIITSRNKSSIEDHFDRNVELESELIRTGKFELNDMVRRISELCDIHYIRQKNALGLGHAVLCARAFIGDEPFAVLLGDDVLYSEDRPALKDLIDIFTEYEKPVLGIGKIDVENTQKYGIIKAKCIHEDLFKVEDVVEKPKPAESPSNLAIFGRYIFTPDIFEKLETVEPDERGEIQLTSAISSLLDERDILAYEMKAKRYDIGDKLGFLIANIEYALRSDEICDDFKGYLKGICDGI